MERHSAYVHIIHIYKTYASVRGFTAGDESGNGNQSNLNLGPMVCVDIYLKVLLISVCLEVTCM